jgi:hypothetical protein
MRTLLCIVAMTALVVAPAMVDAQVSCGRPHTYQSYSYTPYYAPTYSYSTYTPYYNVEYVPKTVLAVANPDYFFSVNSYGRDVMLAESIAYKLMAAGVKYQPQGQTYQQAPANPQPGAPVYPKVGATSTAVSAALTKEVADNCLKCHGGASAKGGIHLDDLASVPLDVRRQCFVAVSAGRMPKGASPRPNEVLTMYLEWIDSAAK